MDIFIQAQGTQYFLFVGIKTYFPSVLSSEYQFKSHRKKIPYSVNYGHL